jgi:hypothetical protein
VGIECRSEDPLEDLLEGSQVQREPRLPDVMEGEPRHRRCAAKGNGQVEETNMKFMLLIYNDPTLLDAMPAPEFDATMRCCLTHADELRRDGRLLDSQMLEAPATAKSVRIRKGRMTAVDGPFAEAKEVLGGFNLIEAADMAEAVQIASEFPWTRTGCVEVRPVRDIGAVRRRVAQGG